MFTSDEVGRYQLHIIDPVSKAFVFDTKTGAIFTILASTDNVATVGNHKSYKPKFFPYKAYGIDDKYYRTPEDLMEALKKGEFKSKDTSK